MIKEDKMKQKFQKYITYIVVILGAITMLFPFIWMIITALKGYGEAMQIPPTILPKEYKFDNFIKAWNTLPFVKLYYNTLVLMFFRIICAVIFSAMAAYAFARIEFPFRNALFSLVLIQMMLPTQIFIIPQYLMVAKLGWLNSVKALVVPGLVSAFGTFLLRQHYKAVPKELEEAAVLDGCNHWRIFWQIMMPLSKNHLVALGIFTALFAYKDLMWPLIVNMSVEKLTLASAITTLSGMFEANYPIIMACSFIAMWPMLLLYLIFQKQFIDGITFTGTKG